MRPEDIPDVIVAKAEEALHDIACSGTGVCDHSDFYQVRARAALAAVWSDIRLSHPKGGCVCSFESEDRGGGHSELVQEYEPACPVHSEHVYDPKTGVWVLRSEIQAAAWGAAVAMCCEFMGVPNVNWPNPHRTEPADVTGTHPGEGGFF